MSEITLSTVPCDCKWNQGPRGRCARGSVPANRLGLSRRRRARRISSRRLSGSARSGRRARLGNWNVDRCNQRQPDRGQPARRQTRPNERLLEARPERSLSRRSFQLAVARGRDAKPGDVIVGNLRFLPAKPSRLSGFEHSTGLRSGWLLLDTAAPCDPGRSCRFFRAQFWVTRLTVGAANVRTGAMRYFDSREEKISCEHIIASGALPPAFPPVRIDGELYWDGGILSNTPVEAVFDDNPRRNSLVFSVHLWNSDGAEPRTLGQVINRQKDPAILQSDGHPHPKTEANTLPATHHRRIGGSPPRC